MDWIGNILIILGRLLLFKKKRLFYVFAFALSLLGDLFWIAYAFTRSEPMFSVAVICMFFAALDLALFLSWFITKQEIVA